MKKSDILAKAAVGYDRPQEIEHVIVKEIVSPKLADRQINVFFDDFQRHLVLVNQIRRFVVENGKPRASEYLPMGFSAVDRDEVMFYILAKPRQYNPPSIRSLEKIGWGVIYITVEEYQLFEEAPPEEREPLLMQSLGLTGADAEYWTNNGKPKQDEEQNKKEDQ